MVMLMNTKEYWEKRLKLFRSLEGVGCIGLGSYFNIYVYRAKVRTLERLARKFRIPFTGKGVLDVGSGIGFWIDYYLSKGTSFVYGVDIASEAIKYLTKKYADHNNVELFEGDFSCLNINKRFDIVNVFDVAYHVVDDHLWIKFIENCCKHVKSGGFIFITDTFKQDYREEITYVKFRSLNAYRKVLRENGVKILSLAPMYSILGWPYTGKRDLDVVLTFFYSLSTQLYERFRPALKLAYYIDSCLTQFKAFGISMKLLVGQKGVN